MVRRGNRTIGARLTREAFEASPYVNVQVVGASGVGQRLARERLAQEKLERRVVLSVPHFMAAASAAPRVQASGNAELPLKSPGAAKPRPATATATPPDRAEHRKSNRSS